MKHYTATDLETVAALPRDLLLVVPCWRLSRDAIFVLSGIIERLGGPDKEGSIETLPELVDFWKAETVILGS